MSLRTLVGLAILFALIPQPGAVAGEIQPNSQLVLDGVPPVPDSLALAVGRYDKGRAADFVAWHPVRREMLIATVFGNTPQIHQVKHPGADRTQLTF
ncbi:MAG TPA: S9 family peptidase, partial [Candidatus Eisenbacteria bacterium]|nr:S9 family peptidase [Candidatus Eisenbacteria bacterium]